MMRSIRALGMAAALLFVAGATASTVAPRNLVHLIDDAQDIVVGSVTAVTDGVDAQGVPYTEVTLAVGEALRGPAQETMSFRQFGLLAPRLLPNGETLYAVRPPGWPQYTTGERVLLFLTRPASQTGLRTTVGLEQGKFAITNNVLRSVATEGALFDGVDVAANVLSAEERALVASPSAQYDANAFIAFVRRAVSQQWIETGSLRHAP
jgi:hypothetical protein